MPVLRFASSLTVRLVFACLCATLPWLAAPALAETLEVIVKPLGSAAGERPLPVGAMPSVTIAVQNGTKRALGPISLTVQFEGLSAANAQGWRAEGNGLRADIARLALGERAERALRLKVERAPLATAKGRVRVEARAADGTTVASETELTIADCVGAYREKLGLLRASLPQAVRDAAEALRRADPALPAGRIFAATGARSGDLAAAERLAAAIAAQRGADPQMATEWFRFLIQRFASELNAYTGQSANPGMCANNYYQIAGYRQGLLPITKRIEMIRAAAETALAAARDSAKAEPAETLAVLAPRAIKDAGLAPNGDEPEKTEALPPLAALAAARELLGRDGKLEAEHARKLSLAETAAWLAETDRRGQSLLQSIEGTLTSIAGAHKESCVCAF